MNRRSVLRGLLATGALCALPGFGMAHAAPSRLITMTSHYPLHHPITQRVFIPWANMLRVQSQGRLEMHIAAPDELCPDENVYNAVLMNTLTLGGFAPNMMISPLPVARLMEYALLYPDARTGSLVLWDVLCNCPELREDLALVRILWAWVSPAMYLHTTGKPVRNLADIRKLKIAVWDTTSGALVTALGAQPVISPAHVSAGILRMRMADAVISPFPPLPTYELSPLLKCTLDLPLSNACFFAAFNREVWGTLNPDDQDLITRTTGARMALTCGENLDSDAVRVRARMEHDGHEFMTLSEDDERAVYQPLLAMRDDHERELVEKKLLPPNGLMNLIRQSRERILRTTTNNEAK